MYIYKITNTVNGKCIIGKTEYSNVDERWIQHKRLLSRNKHYNKHFQASWNKHGESSFAFEVVEKFEPDMNFDLNNLEQYWIKHFDSSNPKRGYNKTLGGDGGKWTEETKVKRSKNQTGKKRKPFSDEHRENISRARKGKAMPDSVKNILKDYRQSKAIKSIQQNKGIEVSIECSPNMMNQIGNSIQLVDQFGNIYQSIAAAARAIKSCNSNIKKQLDGNSIHTKGFVFTKIQQNHPDFRQKMKELEQE